MNMSHCPGWAVVPEPPQSRGLMEVRCRAANDFAGGGIHGQRDAAGDGHARAGGGGVEVAEETGGHRCNTGMPAGDPMLRGVDGA